MRIALHVASLPTSAPTWAILVTSAMALASCTETPSDFPPCVDPDHPCEAGVEDAARDASAGDTSTGDASEDATDSGFGSAGPTEASITDGAQPE